MIELGEYTFDVHTKTLFHNTAPLELTQKVSELLLLLIEGQGKVVLLEHIKARLWSSAEEGSNGALRVYIAQLKKYFPTQIQNVRGVGYQMSLHA